MYQSVSLRRFATVAGVLSATLLIQLPVQAQVKYDPEHPVVQEMITKGLEFVSNNQSNLIGPRIMFGMAAYKANVLASPTPKEHPLIDAALAAIKEKCTESKLNSSRDFEKMYASALACVFLLELDAEKYRPEIETLLDHIVQRQQDSGAWGYRADPRVGDTSQMQYIALALWLADLRGYRVDPDVAKDALQWMLDTQEPDGGWIYQKPVVIAGSGANSVRHSLVAAGLGTVYLYADLLRLVERSQSGSLGPTAAQNDLNLPPSVTDVTHEQDAESSAEDRRALVSFDTSGLRSCMNSGNNWFAKNFSADVDEYPMYYLYGFERYASVRDYVEGNSKGIENWYDEGVDYLRGIQTSNGQMGAGRGEISASIQTCFAILFLTRSMEITIAGKATGLANGGDGFRNDVILRERGDRIVTGSVERSIGDLVSLLDNPDNDEEEWELFMDSLDDLQLDGDEISRSQQLATLRMLVRHEKYEARLIAIKFLGKQRSLDNVPALIYALTDPDPRIVTEANKAMRFVSRRTSGPEVSGNPSRTELRSLKNYWIEWYHKIRPDGVLLEMPEDE
ncbi:MAG: hypothetical protein ACR2NP_04490 [Pirellulaceae bacterium]